MDAVIVLAWLLGTFSGALWMAALEREDHKSARFFGRFMVFSFPLCFLIIAFGQ